jgi:hypothetical protein
MRTKMTLNELEDHVTVGTSHIVGEVPESLKVIMWENSLALENMLTKKSLGLDFVVRMRDLIH